MRLELDGLPSGVLLVVALWGPAALECGQALRETPHAWEEHEIVEDGPCSASYHGPNPVHL